MRLTTNFTGKFLGLKTEKQLRKKNHTDDWELQLWKKKLMDKRQNLSEITIS